MKRRTTQKNRNRKFHVERLEQRELLAADVTATLNHDVLRIMGTEQADTLVVRQVNDQIAIDGVRIRVGGELLAGVPAARVRAVEIHGLAGDDRILLNGNGIDLVGDALSDLPSLTKPTTVFGGAGHDVIRGSTAEDVIFGGPGNDQIWGQAGNDRLFGGAGDDMLWGGEGRNQLVGGAGNDCLDNRWEAPLTAADPVTTVDLDQLLRNEESVAAAVKGPLDNLTVVTPVLTNRILTVVGTKNADTINVTVAGTSISVAGKSFHSADFDLIVITASNGNDQITVSESITKATRIFGGAGDDTIRGGAGADEIYGGIGRDSIYGRGGNDMIYGGSATDVVDGGTGSNAVYQENPNLTYTMNAIEKEVVRLTNLERTKRGLPALTINVQLAKASNLHAANMATRSNTIGAAAAMQHTLSGTTLPAPSDRIDYAGFSWNSYRENIAYGYNTAAAVVKAWMNSSSHQASILATDVTQIGVSYYRNNAGTYFWSQDFGRTA